MTKNNNPLKCLIYPKDTLKNYKFVVVCSIYRGKIVLSRHETRDTWETQGGHIEAGETIFDAAKRELYEESGITDGELTYICDYFGYRRDGYASGAVFLCDVHTIGSLPDSEMSEVSVFDEMPDALTYPLVTPSLFARAMDIYNMKISFRIASKSDADAVYNLYKSVLDDEFTVWSDNYPARENIDEDLAADGLYVLTDSERIIGALSVIESDLDELCSFKINDARHREIARVAVSPEYRGRGYAAYMVKMLEEILPTRGITSIRLAVAKKNIPAYKTYAKSGFEVRGEAFIYESDYIIMEKAL